MRRVALVLAGGGVLGHAFHAGVLAALQEATGWDPRRAELIVGTSAGSLAAAFLRRGISAPDLAARATGAPLSDEGARLYEPLGPDPDLPVPGLRHMDRSHGFASRDLLVRAMRRPGSVGMGALAAAALPPGLVDTSIISDAVRSLHDEGWAAQPTWIASVGLHDGKRVAFGRGDAPDTSLALAVAASCAIPGYFQPVLIEGRRYVDGGAHSASNLDLVEHAGFDLVIASSPMSAASGALAIAPDTPWRTYIRLRLRREAERVRRRGAEVVLFEPELPELRLMGLRLMDYRRQREVSAQARESALKRLREPALRARLAPLQA